MQVDDADPGTDKTRYLHKDHLESIVAMTDELGAVVERLSFDPHGQRRAVDWQAVAGPIVPQETPRGFTGHEHLDGVELIHMNGRVYDPVIGRFLSADPIVQFPETTQGFNRYTYTDNNPLSFTDPSGFFFGENPQASYADEPGFFGEGGFASRDPGFGSGDGDDNRASDKSSETPFGYDYPPDDEDWGIKRRATATTVELVESSWHRTEDTAMLAPKGQFKTMHLRLKLGEGRYFTEITITDQDQSILRSISRYTTRTKFRVSVEAEIQTATGDYTSRFNLTTDLSLGGRRRVGMFSELSPLQGPGDIRFTVTNHSPWRTGVVVEAREIPPDALY